MKSLHKFLRAVGFSKFDTRKKVRALAKACVQDSHETMFTANGEATLRIEYRRDFASNIGLAVCGELEEDDNFSYDYCYPYLRPGRISSFEDINVDRHAFRESYAGICDDVRIGVSLVFYLQNMIEYIKIKNDKGLPIRGTVLSLSALSNSGMIIIPISKDEKQKEQTRKKTKDRNNLLQAARRGDEKAIESLTLDDMDTMSSISKKIHQEDLFSIVDTYFMPYGLECDQYAMLGEITEYVKVQNELTKEYVYIMTINCNELFIDVCINEEDLYGEPAIGRRFKGNIWLQGHINFPG